MNEVRLKEVIVDILTAIESRVTECEQAKRFNRYQLLMFKRMLNDVCTSINQNYNEETNGIINTWQQSQNSDRGYYFMNYIYGIDNTKQYSLS